MRKLALRLGGAVIALLAACGEDDRPAEWTYISATIIQPNCATSRCHSKGSAVFGLQLDSLEGGYAVLVGSPPSAGEVPSGRNFVVPGDPARSKLMHLLHGDETARMPPDAPLPAADIALIEKWILEGARFE
jgi:hypothetical protein